MDDTFERLMALEDVRITVPPDVFDSLPRTTYRVADPPSKTATDTATPPPTCSVCLENYSDGDTQVALPCGHNFHEDCIRTWLGQYKRTCPVCRHELPGQPQTCTPSNPPASRLFGGGGIEQFLDMDLPVHLPVLMGRGSAPNNGGEVTGWRGGGTRYRFATRA